MRRFALLDARAASLCQLTTAELCTFWPLLCCSGSAEARAKFRLAKLAEQRVKGACLSTSRVQVVERVAVRIDAEIDAHLLLILIVGIGGELRVPELVDDFVIDLVVVLRGLQTLPAAPAILHLASHLNATVCLHISQA